MIKYLVNSLEEQKKKETSNNGLHFQYDNLPIQWAKLKPSIEDFAGIWKNRDMSLDQKSKWMGEELI